MIAQGSGVATGAGMQARDQAHRLAEQGRAQLMAGQAQAALALYEEALRLDPDFMPALRGRCQVFQALGQPAEVIAACDQALAHSSDDAGLHHSRAVGLRLLGRLHEAEAGFRRRHRPAAPG